MKPLRVAHLIDHPVEYYVPLYRELASRPGIELTVFYCSDASTRTFYDPGFERDVEIGIPLLDGYDYRFLPSARGAELHAGFFRWPNWDIVRELASGRYEVIWTHGYADVTVWLAALLAAPRGSRLLLRDAQNLIQPRTPARRALKRLALPFLYRRAVGAFVGERARDYFLHYGLPQERLFAAPHCVDNASLQIAAAELAPQRMELRRRFGIDDERPVILFCGKLIEAKRPLVLLEAFARVRSEHACSLLFVGEGEQRLQIEALLASRQIPDVHLAGYLNQAEVPAAYVAADIFCLPSAAEVWGMVVNEAMNFALPLVLSNNVGAAADLVQPESNGSVVTVDDVDDLAAALRSLVADPELRRTWGLRSRELVERYSVERCADGLIAAARAAAGRAHVGAVPRSHRPTPTTTT